MKRGPYAKPPAELRFWPKVDKQTGGCWVWTASKNKKGYGQICVGYGSRLMLAHRFAWELVIGPIPEGMQLDHKCHNPSCVNPDHLRLATNTENSRNCARPVNNKSGFKGVSWDTRSGKWRACICVNNRTIGLGRFADPRAAHEAYCKAAREHFGEFANEGFAAGLALGYVGGKR